MDADHQNSERVRGPLRLGFIGAGRLAQALAPALADLRGPDAPCVVAIASRDAARASALAAQCMDEQGRRAVVLSAAELVAQVDLVWLTVSDDALAPLAAQLPWRAGQAVLHCSGATELSVLAPAADRGARVGGFHPLQIFSDPLLARQRLPGSWVAVETAQEADGVLRDALWSWAGQLGMQPFALPPGGRALYHAAAGTAASALLTVLNEARMLWAALGLPPETALPALLPLARGTLDAAAARGLAGAVSGPLSRGDEGVVRSHLRALAQLDAAQQLECPDGVAVPESHAEVYRQLARRQLPLLAESGRADAAQLARWVEILKED